MSKNNIILIKAAVAFLLISLSLFAYFVLSNPVDWQQPETMRLHYFALQDGVRDGPLSSSLSVNDWLKPLSCQARGGCYEARYIVRLLDGLVLKFNQLLYSLTGPFLDEPLNIFLLIIIAILLSATVYEWTGSRPAAIISSGFWLLTSQTLLDARYPIRPDMVLSSALSLYVFWQILKLRKKSWAKKRIFLMGLALFIAFSSHDISLFLIPALVVLMVLERKSLHSNRNTLILMMGGVLAAYALFLFVFQPFLMRTLIAEEPPWFELKNDSPLRLLDPGIFFQRFWLFTVGGIYNYLKLNLGFSEMIDPGKRLLGGVAAILAAALVLSAGWKRLIPALAVGMAFYLPMSLVMFPLLPSSVEMPVYYFLLPGIMFALLLGASLAPLFAGGFRWRCLLLTGGLLVIGTLNVNIASNIMKEMPGDFGFSDEERRNVRDVLNLEEKIESAGIPLPLYLSYPRPRYFDISTKWDLMLRVWRGEAERIYAMMTPVLHLQSFESGRFRGSDEEFSSRSDNKMPGDKAQVRAFIDMPERAWYDLDLIRGYGEDPESAPVWWTSRGEAVHSRQEVTLLGDAFRAVLEPGKWETVIRWNNKISPQSVLVFLVRADLQAPGNTEVYHRTQPLPEGRLAIRLGEGRGMVRLDHSYSWSYRLYILSLSSYQGRSSLRLEIETDGPAELIGPLVIKGEREFRFNWSEE